ncbi:hypothetical protein GCM10009678_26280 [Actinomadura kijaniata]
MSSPPTAAYADIEAALPSPARPEPSRGPGVSALIALSHGFPDLGDGASGRGPDTPAPDEVCTAGGGVSLESFCSAWVGRGTARLARDQELPGRDRP